MEKRKVYELCQRIGPKYGFDPLLILAMCEQESSYEPTAVRLENGFYRRYVRPQGFAPSTGVLLSASYGLMQVMGLSLHEMDFFNGLTLPGQIAEELDKFILDPEQQVGFGCKWLEHKRGRSGDLTLALTRYNGSAEYPPLVFERSKRLREEFT